MFITRWHHIVKRDGCFQQRLFVCQFVCVFVCPHGNFRTIKRRMMKLGIVQKSRLSLNVTVKGQGHRGQKMKTAEPFLFANAW